MNRVFVALLFSVGALVGMMFLLTRPPAAPGGAGTGDSAGAEPLLVFCAASNRAVMEAIKADYQDECGVQLDIQYGPSQTLFSSIEVSRSGDLYLPADDSYLDLGRDKGLIDEVIPVAAQRGVIAIRKGNPNGINSYADLLRPDVRLVQANPEGAAIGKVARRTLKKQGLWDSLDKATTAYRTTVTEVANDLLVNAADAGIVYDAVLHTYPDLEYIEIPELEDTSSDISLGIISGTRQPRRALHFARFVAASDRGLKRYTEFGFRVKNGDAWEDSPELTIYAGSMLRPAIDESITKFEEREGVRVTRVYNGCGILVANIQAGQKPDAYFACDTEFMQQVRDDFPIAVDVSQNELVIIVQKGNPHKVSGLRDLTKPGLRVGIGHEKQCAMGWLTQNTLKEGGVQKDVMANVTVQAPTGDLLVNQLRTGALDAAVAYLSNAAGSAEFLDAVRITDIECSIATQPFAVWESSDNQQLTRRLFQQICSEETQEDFLAEGFQWKMGASAEE